MPESPPPILRHEQFPSLAPSSMGPKIAPGSEKMVSKKFSLSLVDRKALRTGNINDSGCFCLFLLAGYHINQVVRFTWSPTGWGVLNLQQVSVTKARSEYVSTPVRTTRHGRGLRLDEALSRRVALRPLPAWLLLTMNGVIRFLLLYMESEGMLFRGALGYRRPASSLSAHALSKRAVGVTRNALNPRIAQESLSGPPTC